MNNHSTIIYQDTFGGSAGSLEGRAVKTGGSAGATWITKEGFETDGFVAALLYYQVNGDTTWHGTPLHHTGWGNPRLQSGHGVESKLDGRRTNQRTAPAPF